MNETIRVKSESTKLAEKVWRDKNKDKIIAYRKKYIANNKDKINDYRKNYWDKGKRKLRKDYMTRYHSFHREMVLLTNYRKCDKKKELECNLDLNWLKENITSKPCIYCGHEKNIGCDRIDNNKGHTKNNVVPCCYNCNFIRGDVFTMEEMIKIGLVIKDIKNNRTNKIDIERSTNKLQRIQCMS